MSCVADACVAVGRPAQAWTRGQWRPAAGGGLASVSCVSATWCQAVGSGLSAARWDGRGWQPERCRPGPPGPHAGQRVLRVGRVLPGGRRRAAPARRPARAGHRPGAGRAVGRGAVADDPPGRSGAAHRAGRRVLQSARFCLAVGATDAQDTLAERWTGVRWQVERTPDVNRIGYSVLDARVLRQQPRLPRGGQLQRRGRARRRAVERPPLAAGPVRPHRRAAQRVLHFSRMLVVVSGPARLRWLRLRA